MKILIIGSTGFVGARLLNKLELEGYDVIASSREDCDITKKDEIISMLDKIKPDIIFNLVAYVGNVHFGITNSADIIKNNLKMVCNLYESVLDRKIKPIIISPLANCSYPSSVEIQKEDEWWNGMPDVSALSYATTRRTQFVLAKAYYEQYGINSRHIILPGIYGPGDHVDEDRVHALDGIIMRMLGAHMRKEEKFEVWGTGKPVREWIYIDDVINLLVKVMLLNEADLIYPVNFGQKKGYSIAELTSIISECIGYEGNIVFNHDYADGAMVKILDNKKFIHVFGNYDFVDIKDGIRESIAYYRDVL